MNDSEYQSGFYVVAHPYIFRYCNRNPVCDEHGPFDWYFQMDNHNSLPSSYLHLVQAELNLYNNDHSFSLYLAIGTWCDELFQVFIQAYEIRRRESTSSILKTNSAIGA